MGSTHVQAFTLECRRLQAARRFGPLLLCTLLAGLGSATYVLMTRGDAWQRVEALVEAMVIPGLITPLIAVAVAGDSIVLDRRAGYIWFLLGRLGGKGEYAGGKVLGMAAMAAAVVGLGALLALLVVAAYGALASDPAATTANAGLAGAGTVAVRFLALPLAAAALVGIAALASVWIVERYTVMAVPLVLFAAGFAVLPAPLNPGTHLFLGGAGTPWWGSLAYWPPVAVAALGAAVWCLGRRDLLD